MVIVPTNKNLCLERNQMIYFCGLLQKQKQPQKQTLFNMACITVLLEHTLKNISGEGPSNWPMTFAQT
jgi:hypothetical protein